MSSGPRGSPGSTSCRSSVATTAPPRWWRRRDSGRTLSSAPLLSGYDEEPYGFHDSRNRRPRSPRHRNVAEPAAQTTDPSDHASGILASLAAEISASTPADRRDALLAFAKMLLHRLSPEEIETLGVQQ